MDWTAVLNIFYCHKVAHKIIDQMYKDARVFSSPDGVLQGEYFKGGTKKLGDSNVEKDNADAAQTKTKSALSKKQDPK